MNNNKKNNKKKSSQHNKNNQNHVTPNNHNFNNYKTVDLTDHGKPFNDKPLIPGGHKKYEEVEKDITISNNAHVIKEKKIIVYRSNKPYN